MKKLDFKKYCLIIVPLVFVSIQIYAQNGWTKKTDMLTIRAGTSSSVVDNKIYVIGGSTPSLTDLAANEMYDPATDTWEAKKSMPTARGFLFTAAVNDTIYAIGGGYPSFKLKVEAFDPVTNSWTTKKDMPEGHRGCNSACVVDGIIYLIGGNYNESECWAYNPSSDEWMQKTSMPADGGGALSVTVYNGLIYTFGGSTYSPWAARKTVFAYDPQIDTWTKKKDMPTARFALQTFLVNDKIYAVGGGQYDGNCLSTVEVYDPITDTWTAKPNMPISTAWITGAAVNNKIYVFAKMATGWSAGWGDVWEYDPSLDTPKEIWTKKADIPKGGGTASVINGKIYVLGGTSIPDLNDLACNFMYDPSTDKWDTNKTCVPTPRGFLTSAVVDNKIYVIGGGYPDSTNKNEVYDPASDTWTTKKEMINPRLGMRAAVVDGIIYIFGGNYNERNCHAYDPATNSWVEKTPIPSDGPRGVLSVTDCNGLIYVFGGSDEKWGAYSTVYAYDPKTDTYSQKKNMPTPRYAFQTFLVNGKIYALGGSNEWGTSLTKVEVYDPATDTWETKPKMPKYVAWFAGAVVNDKIYVIGGTPDWGMTSYHSVWEYDPALDTITTGVERELITPKDFALYQNYPNPFNPSTTLSFVIGHSSLVSLKVYDVLGREITTLINEEKPAGTYILRWNAEGLSSGVYFYQIKVSPDGGQLGTNVETKKMILLH